MTIMKYVVGAFAYFLIAAGALEIFARAIGYEPLRYTRPYDPLFVSGEGVYHGTREELIDASNGPSANGYEQVGFGTFVWNGRDVPRSSTALSDFLFSHSFSRYSSRDVDTVLCSQPDAPVIFVFGGSVAMGFAASSKSTTWDALLEAALTSNLQRHDIFVVNAAMGGFNSLQEKLAYYLAAVPRDARFVLLVNGWNNLVSTLRSSTRPRDPLQLGSRYTQFYGNLATPNICASFLMLH